MSPERFDAAPLVVWAGVWLLLWPAGYLWQRFRQREECRRLENSALQIPLQHRGGNLLHVPRVVSLACGEPVGAHQVWFPHFLVQVQAWAGLGLGVYLSVSQSARAMPLWFYAATLAVTLIAPIGLSLEERRARRVPRRGGTTDR